MSLFFLHIFSSFFFHSFSVSLSHSLFISRRATYGSGGGRGGEGAGRRRAGRGRGGAWGTSTSRPCTPVGALCSAAGALARVGRGGGREARTCLCPPSRATTAAAAAQLPRGGNAEMGGSVRGGEVTKEARATTEAGARATTAVVVSGGVRGIGQPAGVVLDPPRARRRVPADRSYGRLEKGRGPVR